MAIKSLVSLVALLLSVSISSVLQARDERIDTETVIGTVVGYDEGVELANLNCRQTLIVRTKNPPRQRSEYIIVRYENSCLKLIPQSVIKNSQEWRFSLTRQADCDQSLGELLYITSRSPGGNIRQIPRVALIRGSEREDIPRDTKLPCYTLSPGHFEPPLRERILMGVVIGPDSRPVAGASIKFRHADTNSFMLVDINTDNQGQFSIPIYEGVEYALQAIAKIGGRFMSGELVKIPAAGEIRPLRLVIK